jgi:hypothetical protein
MAGLADHVRSGRKVDPSAPGGFWDYLAGHPEDVPKFVRAMGSATARLVQGLTDADYRPPSSKLIVDVGGSRGTLLAWLLNAVPEARGIVFDRPESLVAAPAFLESAGVADRAETVGGTFLTEVPEGDMHVLSRVLHNWDDDGCRRIIGNIAKAARPGASLVLIEYVLPSVPEPTVGHMMDVMMMVLYGGRERTVEQHRAIVEPAGYTFSREVPIGGVDGMQPPLKVLEFRRI